MEHTMEHAVCEIMSQATKSAIQHANFPLDSCEVQCAFEHYIQHHPMHPGLEWAIRRELHRLGFGV
jgi:hypothetical protein